MKIIKSLLFMFAMSALLAACAPAATVDTMQVKNQPISQITGKTADYTLVSAISGSGMIFVGKGGIIDGQTNPALKAGIGDTVRVTLISGEGAMHNIRFDAVSYTHLR